MPQSTWHKSTWVFLSVGVEPEHAARALEIGRALEPALDWRASLEFYRRRQQVVQAWLPPTERVAERVAEHADLKARYLAALEHEGIAYADGTLPLARRSL
ncbi:hypothetical protein [Calidithermus chliarophilus]|uniref:hypothetical protein n=1 Tax=Calidithermus chliarophilus TaxID=52023 RepID=UPI00042194EF|nr:hypothetical protein [Calidithermus chliarophilus]